jgi:hypothetical protein
VRAIYFPPPWRKPEAIEHPWAVLRYKRGDGLRFTRVLPSGYARLLCRAGVHVMIERFISLERACECRAYREDLRRR